MARDDKMNKVITAVLGSLLFLELVTTIPLFIVGGADESRREAIVKKWGPLLSFDILRNTAITLSVLFIGAVLVFAAMLLKKEFSQPNETP